MDVIPAKAGIRYAGKAEINPIGRGVLGRPVKPGDDSGVLLRPIAPIVVPASAEFGARNPVMTPVPLT